MQTVIDAFGQSWSFNHTVATRNKCLGNAECQIDIALIFQRESLTRIQQNPALLAWTMWLCVEDQAEKREVSATDFYAERFNTLELLKKLEDAFFDAAVDFQPEDKKKAARKILETGRLIDSKTTETVMPEILGADPERIAQDVTNEIKLTLQLEKQEAEKRRQRVNQTLKTSPSPLPKSPDSSTDRPESLA